MSDTAIPAEEVLSESERISFTEARARYQGVVFAYVSRRIKPIEEAEDLVAQVFLDAFRHWHRVKTTPKLYLLGIARRKLYSAYRRRRKVFPLNDTDAMTEGMADLVHFSEVRDAVSILNRLPADEREALLLQVLEDLPVADISVVLGRSVKATNSLLQRARTRVRKLADPLEVKETHL